MDIYCLFQSKQDPTLDFNIYLLFVSNVHSVKVILNTRDFNEDHIYNILTKDKGNEIFGNWRIFYQTTIDKQNEKEKRIYFSNINLRIHFSVLFKDIKKSLIKIYQKVKI